MSQPWTSHRDTGLCLFWKKTNTRAPLLSPAQNVAYFAKLTLLTTLLTTLLSFTINDFLKELNIKLNIPPFLEGWQQLPVQEMETGSKLASPRIHVEQTIGRIKTFTILRETIISMARLTNQSVNMCAFLSNFQPALVPLPQQWLESDVDNYFEQL